MTRTLCVSCLWADALTGDTYCPPCRDMINRASPDDQLAWPGLLPAMPSNDANVIDGQTTLADAIQPSDEGDDPMHKPHSKLAADWRDHPADPAPVPSPIGDRFRGIANAILVLADANADAPTDGAYDEGYAHGAEHAYRTAAILVQAMSRAEDYR